MKNFTKQNIKTCPLWIRLLIMTFMLLVGTSSAWAANVYITTTSTSKINFYTWDNTCNSTGWPGVSLTTGATKNDNANGGGFYKFPASGNCSDNSYSYIINNGSSQTGDLSISSTTWGVYNGTSTFTVLMTEANMSSKSITFRSDALSGWSTNTSTTWDATKKKYKTAEVNYSKQSGIDVYIAGTKFIYKAPANFDTPATGNYIIYWDPYTSDITFETPCPTSVTTGTVSGATTICSGEDAAVSLSGNSTGSTIQWQKSTTSPTSGFANINGATSTSYTAENLTQTTYFRAVVTLSKNGCDPKTDNSEAVTITVNSLPAAPTLNPNSTTVCSGKAFTLPGDYNWYEESTGGTKLNSATISGGITSNKSYWAEAKNASGCVSSTRTEYTVTVNDKPLVPSLSADKTSLIGDEKAEFIVSNTVAGLTYTLYNGENAGESQTSTGSDLTFEAGDAGSYTVKVSNDCGTSTSSPIEITVCTPQTNEFRHANSNYTQLPSQPTYYPGDKAYFVSTITCCLTGNWSANLQTGEEAWYTDLTEGTPRFYMTLTRAGEFTITNMANNGCTQDNNVLVNLDFTVTALSQVTNANGTASGANIALTWNHSANHSNVMVVRYPIGETETIPAGGQAYTAGNTLGGGTVVYVGTAESYTDKNLPAGVSYKYYFYTVNNNYYSEGVALNMTSCPTPAEPQLTASAVTACDGEVTANGYITITNMANYKDDTYTFKLGDRTANPDANGKITISSADYTEYTVTVINSCGNSNSADVEIAINDNAPVITGNTSFQPNGSTTLTSDKGASTTWEALDGGDITSSTTGTSIVFTAEENGTYRVQATYNGCSTIVEIKVQDDLYVWVRRPIKKETAYDQFYHKDQNTEQGGDLFYKEFASLSADYTQYNKGGKAAEQTCTDKDGYTWYGFVVSKTAIENDYYFTVHAPNDKGYGGYHTHTYATQLVDMDADLYFVMDETPSNVSRGWNINAPVVVRASGDASFNGNNFADFVPLYVKDANICGKEVVSFEWQKSDSQNGAYSTYKSGKGINNIRTREAGWYRCVVTYGDGKGTATSNAIQVTNAGGTSYSFTSNLPIVMVNTNGVGFPNECTVAGSKYPSAVADDMKAKISVDVIIKKGDEVLYDRKARMNYRGSSSLNFKKKSYAFVSGQDSCVFDKSRHDYVKTKKAKMLNILGLDYAANDKDWVMYAATADPSMIRNRLVFDLYQKMRPNDWGVHSTYVELVVDGEYKGVYVFMDKITANEKRVNIVDGTGFIVKWDKTDIADRYVDGSPETDSDEKTFKTTRTGNKDITTYGTKVDQLFEIEYPEKEDIVDAGGSWSGTVETIKQRFEDFETALEAKNYEQVRAIIDYDSWADWFILNEFTKNLDAYRASCIFTCKGQGYKIQAVPLWDQELSFNNAAANISGKGANSTSGLLIQNSGVYSDAFPAPFWFTGGGTSITGGLLNDPCFISLVKEKWATYTADGGVLTSAKINDMVDAYKADLGAIGTNTTPIYRENQMIPFNNNTNAGRGATSSCTGSQAIGYFGYGENCGSAVTHDNSITAIKNWIPARITGLTSALEPLEGEALIFLVSPATQDVTPWQIALVSVQAPSGYTYTIDYSAITAAGGEVTENNNTYSIKLPRPNGWTVGGNGDNTLSIPYQISASIEVDDEGNACGTTSPGGEDTKTATITLKDELEDCDPPVVRD